MLTKEVAYMVTAYVCNGKPASVCASAIVSLCKCVIRQSVLIEPDSIVSFELLCDFTRELLLHICLLQ